MDAHNGDLGLPMCADWKQKIESKFPKLFKKQEELNKWFKDDRVPKWMLYYTDKGTCYGFGADGVWSDEDKTSRNPYDIKNNRLATDQEVEQALQNELEKRDIKKGAFVDNSNLSNDFNPNNKLKSDIVDFSEFKKLGYIWVGRILVYDNGKFATAIPNIITKAEAEEKLGVKIID